MRACFTNAAGPTRHLRPHRHDDAILGGDDVEPFGPIVADPVQRPAAARAATGLGSDLDLVTRKMRRQRGAGLVGRPLAPCRRDAGGLLTLFDEQFGFGHRHVAIFERQRELTAVDLFRSLAEVHAVENIKKVLEPGGAEPFGDDHRLQCLDVVGQLFHPLAHGADR